MSKRKSSFVLLFFLLLLVVMAGPNIAASNLRGENPALRNRVNHLHGDLVNGKLCVLGGKVSSPFQQRITYDQKHDLYRVEYKSDIYEFTAVLDPDLVLKHSEWLATNSALITHLGYDKRITSYDPGQEALCIEYYHGAERKETKRIICNGEAIDSDLIYLYLQRVLADQAQSGCEVVVKSRGLKIKVTFSQVTTADLMGLTPQYCCVEEFRHFAEEIKAQGEELDVYIMDLNGIAKWFIPYKYYIAFRQDPPLQLVGYWGGPPHAAEFLYITNNKQKFN